MELRWDGWYTRNVLLSFALFATIGGALSTMPLNWDKWLAQTHAFDPAKIHKTPQNNEWLLFTGFFSIHIYIYRVNWNSERILFSNLSAISFFSSFPFCKHLSRIYLSFVKTYFLFHWRLFQFSTSVFRVKIFSVRKWKL